MSASHQRRRLVGATLAALVVGGVFGIALGRTTAPDVDDALNSSRRRAQDIAAALQTLPLEYQQSQEHAAGEDQARIESAVKIVVDMLPAALDQAPWLGPTARSRVTDSVNAVQAAVKRSAPVSELTAAVNDAVAAVQDVFATGG